MQPKNKRLKIFFLILYIGIVFIYLLTCLTPFLNPATFWFIAILGIGFPLLLLLLIVCMIITALRRSKWFFLSLAALLVSWQQLSVVFAFHTNKEFNGDKGENLRVLSWNVSSWTENHYSTDKVEATGLRNLMMDAVQMQDADVLCFQEYFESFAPELYPQNAPVFRKMGFNYYYFTPSLKIINGAVQTGLCIFSKYPIVDSAFYKPEEGSNGEGCSMVDIQFKDKIIRVVNTHLQSPRLARGEYSALSEVTESRSVLGKIKRAYFFRSREAQLVRNHIDTSAHPVILCGDFNDVPNSYSYFTIRGKLQDAFLKKGSGIGKTFQFISPTLRIDYMMADQRLKIEQFSKLDYTYSDHYPQLMDVSVVK
jgi:endonuclease/exonuclease/phosphatase family metal-dependent hydrolase